MSDMSMTSEDPFPEAETPPPTRAEGAWLPWVLVGLGVAMAVYLVALGLTPRSPVWSALALLAFAAAIGGIVVRVGRRPRQLRPSWRAVAPYALVCLTLFGVLLFALGAWLDHPVAWVLGAAAVVSPAALGTVRARRRL